MSTKSLRVVVLVCSTRPGAMGPTVGRWLLDAVAARAGELDAGDAEERAGLSRPRMGVEADRVRQLRQHVGGHRSVQHAKQVVTTLRLVPLGATVAIRIGTEMKDAAGVALLDELVRVAHALRPMRARSRAAPGPLPGSYVRRLTPDDAAQVTVLQRCCWVDEAIANDTLRTAEATAAPGCRRVVIFTGAHSEGNIALYRSEGYHLLPDTGGEGIAGLAKDLVAA